MKIYDYDPVTGEILSYDGREAREDPREPGRFLISRCSTDIKPPKKKKGFAIIFGNNKWNEVVDHRGKQFYRKDTGDIVTVDHFGENAINGLTHVKPPEDYPDVVWSEEEQNWVRDPEKETHRINVEAERFLKQTDWYVVRKIETGKEIPEDILKAREEAREQIVRE